jgi:hypothetical protein
MEQPKSGNGILYLFQRIFKKKVITQYFLIQQNLMTLNVGQLIFHAKADMLWLLFQRNQGKKMNPGN